MNSDLHIPYSIIVFKPKLSGHSSDRNEYWVDLTKEDVSDFIAFSMKTMEEIQAQVKIDDLSGSLKSFGI